MNEINNLAEVYGSYADYHSAVSKTIKETVDWADKRLNKIIRRRLLSDPCFPAWDISYCHGQLKDGTSVNVELPFPDGQLPKGKGRITKAILAEAKVDGVYAKGLGIFNAISCLS